MTYQTLARKYRPRVFDDVVAQEHVTTTLKNAIETGRIGSGYLFCGPRGTGKTSVARILARSINCDQGPTVTPCGECDSCKSVGAESSMDVREIDAASNTSVDDIRTLRENVRYGASSEKKKKIYIIDEVHRLSRSAFDALLKTLEEPPPHVIFIFATTEPQNVPETILSRTQRFDFRRVALAELTPALKKIAETEGFTVIDDALRLIARRGEGSVRDSISLLDQLLSFSRGEVTAELVIKSLGLVDHQYIFNFVEKLAAGEAGEALAMVAHIADSGSDLKEFTRALAEHFRALTILNAAGTEKALSIIDYSADEITEISKQVDFYTIGDLARVAEILAETITSMKDIDSRWALEIATVKLAHLESTIRLEEILSHIDSGDAPIDFSAAPNSPGARQSQPNAQRDTDLFRREKQSLTFQTPAPSPAPSSSQVSQSFSGDAPHLNLPRVQKDWNNFLEHLKGKSRMLGSQLSMAELREVKNNNILAVFPMSGQSNMSILQRSENVRMIESELREFYEAPVSISYEVDRNSRRGMTVDTATDDAQIDKNQLLESDPQLKKVVEGLDGDIVRVRKIKSS